MGKAGEEEDSLWRVSTLFPGLFCFCPLLHPSHLQPADGEGDEGGTAEGRDGVTLENNRCVQKPWWDYETMDP